MKTSKHKNINIQKCKNKNCLNVCMFKCLNDNRGYSAIVSVFIVTTIGLIIVTSISSIMIAKEKIVRNILNSAQSYYTAESGIEDTILRVIDSSLSYQTTNSLTLAGSTASTTVTQVGNNLTITSEGNKNDYIRSVRVGLTASSEGASFNYGVQVGAGGLQMKNKSKIKGSVYSNGNITAVNSPEITGDAWAASTSTIDNFTIGGEVHANTITDSDIGGDAYYQNISGSTVGGASYPGSTDPDPLALPFTQSKIDAWKAAALSGGVISGNYLLDSTDTATLGPKKITGDLSLNDKAILTLTGTIHVQGDVLLENSAVLELGSGYGSNSGILIADGQITLKNDFLVCGSEGYDTDNDVCNTANDTYILLLSTKASTDSSDPAMLLENNSDLRAILYTTAGVMVIKNNATVKEATGYAIETQNNAEIIYESGLANMNFTAGPGGGWNITGWTEVE